MIQAAIGYRVEGDVQKSGKEEVMDDSVDADESEGERANCNSKEEMVRVQRKKTPYKIATSTELSISDLMADVFDVSSKDNDFLFYRDQIMNKPSHVNFLGADGPVSVSYFDDASSKIIIALSRTPNGTRRVTVPYAMITKSWWRTLFGLAPAYGDILRAIESSLPTNKMKRVTDPRLPRALLSMEEQQQIKGFKFGILYAKEGQTKEDEMFTNVENSPEFEDFLDFLGDRVPLEQWSGFRGGLDVKSRTTGDTSIYKKFNNNEIMFHVSTLLPFNSKDKQQLERKRHIGNDIVVIVWQDGNTVYKPTTISSRQVHVVFVVHPVAVPEDPSSTYYRVGVVSRDGVPQFGPPLANNLIFKKSPEFLNFFYAKLLNAERACYSAPILSSKLTRTRTSLLSNITQSFLKPREESLIIPVLLVLISATLVIFFRNRDSFRSMWNQVRPKLMYK